jgi:hypothetical protein
MCAATSGNLVRMQERQTPRVPEIKDDSVPQEMQRIGDLGLIRSIVRTEM